MTDRTVLSDGDSVLDFQQKGGAFIGVVWSGGVWVQSLLSSHRLCPSVTRNYNAILAGADYNKLIFLKGFSQRGHFGGVLPKPDA
jgi:hypothetical protein